MNPGIPAGDSLFPRREIRREGALQASGRTCTSGERRREDVGTAAATADAADHARGRRRMAPPARALPRRIPNLSSCGRVDPHRSATFHYPWCVRTEFAADSPLEGDGFELPVPRVLEPSHLICLLDTAFAFCRRDRRRIGD